MRLHEQMILNKSKVSELDKVVKLNCAGMGLDDISIVKELGNVETLSLSANNIDSLEALQHCGKLKSVFLRRNRISDINQLAYLGKLPMLTQLAVSENPFAESLGADYRATVLARFPHLTILDGQDVTETELKNAIIRKAVNKALVMDSSIAEASLAPSCTSQQRNNLRQPQLGPNLVASTRRFVSPVPSNCSRDEGLDLSEMEEDHSTDQFGSMGMGSPKCAHFNGNAGCDADGVQMQVENRNRKSKGDEMRLLTAAKCIVNNLNLNSLEEIVVLARARIDKIRRSN